MSVLHEKLCDTHCCRLADIRILVAHAMAQGLDQTRSDFVDMNIAHGADSERANKRVRILHVLKVKGIAVFFSTEGYLPETQVEKTTQ